MTHVSHENLQAQSISAITNTNITEIPAQLTFQTTDTQPIFTPQSVLIFPDSGASICIAGTEHLSDFDIDERNLLPCNKTINAVGGSTLKCRGWIPTKFTIKSNKTLQPLYICDKVDKIYLSHKGCTDTNILPTSFPYPMFNNPTVSSISTSDPKTNQLQRTPPPRPDKLPHPPTEENIPLLEKFILDQFNDTAFNKSPLFPSMCTKPAQIHLKPGYIPYAHHVPIPVPFHWKEEVK